MTRKNKFKRLLSLGLDVICIFNFNMSKSLTDTNSKANLKNGILEKNNNLENKNFSNKKNNNQDNLNKYLKYGAIGLCLLGGACLLYELDVLIKNRMPKPVEPEKEIPPFAGLTQSGMNCYINSTLQILYEDPEFRKYINENSNNVTDKDCDEIFDLTKKDRDNYYLKHESDPTQRANLIYELKTKIANIRSRTLHSVFLDMDKNKHGGTVSQTLAKKQFESSVGHVGKCGGASAIFREIYTIKDPKTDCGTGYIGSVYDLSYSDSDNFNIQTYDYGSKTNYQYNDLSKITPNSKSLWLTASMYNELPSGIKTPKELPMTLNLNNGKTYKLKGISTFTPGHYYGYKTDINGDWWRIDASSRRKEQPSILSLCTNNTSGVALAYYQEVEQN